MNKNTIDLRSDTITKPTPEMLEAMMTAEVGDDVFDGDPTVNALQEKVSSMFGMESALYCPSGTMTNQIAMRISTNPQDEVICDKTSHIYLYEVGGMAYNSMLSPKLLNGDRGRLNAEMVEQNISPDDIHHPITSLVGLENTMNRGGGSIYSMSEIREISKVCKRRGIKLHLDGARLFNALVETGDDPKEYGQYFDTISICFSKGLGAPVGSVLLSNNELNKKAKRVRKVFGGGMRQAGYLAAACSYALDHHVERLKEDHQRARVIGEEVGKCAAVKNVMPVDTNIVIAEVHSSNKDFLDQLESQGVLGVSFGPGAVRFVTHLDFTDEHLDRLVSVLNKLK